MHLQLARSLTQLDPTTLGLQHKVDDLANGIERCSLTDHCSTMRLCPCLEEVSK